MRALADGAIHATLDQPVAKPAKLIAAHSVWVCDGASCAAAVPISDSLSVDGCKDLARKVGPISAYGAAGQGLNAADLAKCNLAARTPAATTASR